MKISLASPMSLALLLFSAAYGTCTAGAESAPAAPGTAQGDTATFVGRTDNSVRYLRLGKLALENGDAETAVNFLRQALPSLQEPAMRCQTLDLLHASLLASGRIDDARELLKTASASEDLANRGDYAALMRGRELFNNKEFAEAGKIFQQLSEAPGSDSYVTLQALELFGRSLHQQRDYRQSRFVYEKLAKQAKDAGDMWLLKAYEGIIFNSLELNETEPAQKAFLQLQAEVPQDLQLEFADRIKRIDWLLQCFNSNTAEMENSFQNAANDSQYPDMLLSRIALRLSDKYLSLNNFEQAVRYCVLSLELAEKTFRQTALRNLIEVRLAAGQSNEVLPNIKDYLQDFPQASDRSSMLMLAGRICTQQEDLESALQYFRQLFDNPNEDEATRCQAAVEMIAIYQKTAQQQQAIDLFNFAIAHTPERAAQRQLQQRLGEYLYQLGRYADAAVEFERVASAGDSRGALWLAQSYYQLKSYSRAMKALKSFDNYGDKTMQLKADYLLALLTEKLAPAESAIKHYSAFAEKYSDQTEGANALFQAGLLAINSKKYNAPKIFRDFAVRYPGDRAANALYKALSIYLANNNEKDAATVFEQLIADYPDNKFTIGSYFVMSNYFRQNQRCQEALELLEKIKSQYAASNPELLPEILYDQALNYKQLNDYRLLKEVLEQLTRNHADHPVAAHGFFLLGDLQMMQGNYLEALKCFQQAQERSGGGVFGYGCAGRLADASYALYISNNQKQYLRQAAECYENLLKVEDLPRDLYYQSLYKLGNCLLSSGDQAGALRCYREILYRSELARRESRYYPEQWCAKALEGAMKLLLPAIRKAPDVEQFTTLRNEAERLLKIAEQLNIPGEEPLRRLEVLRNIKFNAK